MPIKRVYLSETLKQRIEFIPHNPGGQMKEVEQRIITQNALAVIKLDVQWHSVKLFSTSGQLDRN